MTINQNRIPGIILADDGSPNADDIVDVTLQVANNFDTLANSVGILHVLNSSSFPVINNFIGRLVQADDTGILYQYNGAGWTKITDPSFGFECSSSTNFLMPNGAGINTTYTVLGNNSTINFQMAGQGGFGSTAGTIQVTPAASGAGVTVDRYGNPQTLTQPASSWVSYCENFRVNIPAGISSTLTLVGTTTSTSVFWRLGLTGSS